MIYRKMKGLVPLTWIHAKSDSVLEDWNDHREGDAHDGKLEPKLQVTPHV